MSKIPKFRAWYEQGGYMMPVEEIDFKQRMINKSGIWRWFSEVELMQSTGLKDKNGVEIYEGDIVHFKTDGMSGLGFVYWKEELGQWWIKDIREATKKRGQRYYPFWKDCEYRIDGNIYENPELLD